MPRTAAPRTRTDTGPAKPLRSDAQRNRARILAAAETVFAAGGPSASTEEIARLAEVAVGTVFRHFPTKEALIEAVFVDRLNRLADEARALSTADDPGAAFFGFFTEAVGRSVLKHVFTGNLTGTGSELNAVQAAIAKAGKGLRQAMGHLLTRAQRAGAVRGDIGIPELVALVIGAARAMEHTGPDPRMSARILTVVVDGLRPPRHQQEPAPGPDTVAGDQRGELVGPPGASGNAVEARVSMIRHAG